MTIALLKHPSGNLLRLVHDRAEMHDITGGYRLPDAEIFPNDRKPNPGDPGDTTSPFT